MAKIKKADLAKLPKYPQVWDPVPEWLTLNKDIQKRFAKLQIEFKLKELDIQRQKLEAFDKLLR